jgi:inner membrane protein
MENLAHSLLGAVLAEATLPRNATRAQRTVFYATGIIAANLPDADLVYTSITPAPLGYLLHHRGHTHTIVGLAGFAALVGLIALLPPIRRQLAGAQPSFWMLVVASLASHLIADSWNSYGVHPFWPLDNRWFYGDAVFIAEPWLWMLLGVSVALNARNARVRLLLAGGLIALPLAAAWLKLISFVVLVPIAIIAMALVALMRAWPSRRRAYGSLVATVTFVLVSFVLGRMARAAVTGSDVVDVVLSPRPANPLCWTALRMTLVADTLVLRHGTIAVGAAGACGERERVRWLASQRQSVSEIQRLARTDCWTGAWLQFGRAPLVDAGWIGDARFGGSSRGSFTAMQVVPAGRACPPHLTNWDFPRADVIGTLRQP